MIDTIKLAIPAHRFSVARPTVFSPSLDLTKDYRGTFRTVCNPTAAAKKEGKYQPRLTYVQRPSKQGTQKELLIELSLPKLLYRNNFDELVPADFDRIVSILRTTLREMGVWVALDSYLAEADVRAIHYSKNIVFDDYISCSAVLTMLASADISRVYDVQRTDFRNGGHVLHVHTNSLDIALYDKIADLRQERISPKRSQERDGYTQLSLLDEIDKPSPLSVLRYEIRLNGKKKIETALAGVGYKDALSFRQLFSSDISKRLLQDHWLRFFENLPLIPLDAPTPDKLLANILQSESITRPAQAAAALGMNLLMAGSDARYARSLFEDRFGKHVWSRVKHLATPPRKVQYQSILRLNSAIQDFMPTRLENIKKWLDFVS